MKRLHPLALALAILLVVMTPTLAQEATEPAAEATAPAPDTVINVEPGATVIVTTDAVTPADDNTKTLLAIAFGVAVLIVVLVAAYLHVPSWAQQMLLQNRVQLEQVLDTGTGALVTVSRTTPNKLDDVAADIVRELARKEVKRLLDELQASGVLPPAPPPAQTTGSNYSEPHR